MSDIADTVRDALVAVLTEPLAILFLVFVSIAYICITQSRRFTAWLTQYVNSTRVVETYLDTIEVIASAATRAFFPSAGSAWPAYLRFLSLSLGYSSLWYLAAWSFGANLRVGEIYVIPAELTANREGLLAFLLVLAILIVAIASSLGKVDRAVAALLKDDQTQFTKAFRPYKRRLGLTAGGIVLFSLLYVTEFWLFALIANPAALLDLGVHGKQIISS